MRVVLRGTTIVRLTRTRTAVVFHHHVGAVKVHAIIFVGVNNGEWHYAACWMVNDSPNRRRANLVPLDQFGRYSNRCKLCERVPDVAYALANHRQPSLLDPPVFFVGWWAP